MQELLDRSSNQLYVRGEASSKFLSVDGSAAATPILVGLFATPQPQVPRGVIRGREDIIDAEDRGAVASASKVVARRVSVG